MSTKGHRRKLKKSDCRRDIKKYSFPHRSITAWNKLNDETVCAKTIHKFKENLDENRLGSRTACASFPVFHTYTQMLTVSTFTLLVIKLADNRQIEHKFFFNDMDLKHVIPSSSSLPIPFSVSCVGAGVLVHVVWYIDVFPALC